MSPNVKLTVDLLGKSIDSISYRSMIASLLYITASRPDFSFSVGVCELSFKLIQKNPILLLLNVP